MALKFSNFFFKYVAFVLPFFLPMFLFFFNFLKISKYFCFSDISRGDRKKTLGRYGLNKKATQVQYLFFLHNQESNRTY